MFKKINRLIPIFERYECRDFTRFFISKDLYEYINNKVYPEIKVQQNNDNIIPFNEKWEIRDFYKKNGK